MTEGTHVRKGTLIRTMKRYLGDSSGNISLFFGLAAIPLLLAVGAGLDTARINREHTTFHAAVDTAAIAIAGDVRSATDSTGNVPAANLSALQLLAKEYIKSNYSPDKTFAGEVNVDLSITGSKIKIDAKLDFPTTIMKLVNIDSVALQTSSTVEKAMRPVELVLVMDTTGSMGSSGGTVNGQYKIYWAKQAAHDLLAKIYSGTRTAMPRSEYLRVALVPFAAAVRIDPTTSGVSNWVDTAGTNPLSKVNFSDPTYNNYNAWAKLRNSSNTANLTWNGCLETRARGSAALGTDYNANDTAPSSVTPATMFPAYFAPDMPSIRDTTSYDGLGTPGRWRKYSFYNSYIAEDSTSTAINLGTAVTKGETAGLTPVQKASFTPVNSTTNPLAVATMQFRMKNAPKYVNAVMPGGETGNGPWAGCAATPIVPMTFDRETVEVAIDAMTARGATVIPEGLAWGMRVISPSAPFTTVSGSGAIPSSTIASYNNPRWQKVMLLMTDGENDLAPGLDDVTSSGGYTTNERTYMNAPVTRKVGSISYSAYGYPQATGGNNRFAFADVDQAETSLNDDLLNVCSKVKANNVALYVTSFGSGVGAPTQTLLSSCATAPSYYKHSSDGIGLSAFFDQVGQDVLNKMVFISK
jgi:Flp pilus assembly protein TadG